MILAFWGKLFNLFDRFENKCISAYTKSRFCSCGRHVYLGKGSVFTPTSISVGDNVYIGARCVIQSAHGQIFIGNHVMLGPGVHVHGGNHPINVIGGGYMDQIQKKPNSDGAVKIEDDVWIGANAIILPRVTIHRGAVVGAGAVVTHDVSAYSVVAGNPARVLRMRFSLEEIAEYEKALENGEIQ